MPDRNAELVREHWTSLDELLDAALRSGFNEDQFACAVESVGRDPQRIANELQRHLLMAAMRERSKVA